MTFGVSLLDLTVGTRPNSVRICCSIWQTSSFWFSSRIVRKGRLQCFFICFTRNKKISTPKIFAPFGGDFGPVLNRNAFEINHFCAPQAKILNILRLKNDFSFIFRCIFWKIPKFSDFFSPRVLFKIFTKSKILKIFAFKSKKKHWSRVLWGAFHLRIVPNQRFLFQI